nr:MAG TPA: hypothetical protein [Caudoviricetes sp.]
MIVRNGGHDRVRPIIPSAFRGVLWWWADDVGTNTPECGGRLASVGGRESIVAIELRPSGARQQPAT